MGILIPALSTNGLECLVVPSEALPGGRGYSSHYDLAWSGWQFPEGHPFGSCFVFPFSREWKMVMDFYLPRAARCRGVWCCVRMGCLEKMGMAALVSLGLHIQGCQQRWATCPGPGVVVLRLCGSRLRWRPSWVAALMGEFPHPKLRETKSYDLNILAIQ